MSLEETMELIINVMRFADKWEGEGAESEVEASAPLLLAYEGLLS